MNSPEFEQFNQHVGDQFELALADGNVIELRLAEVTAASAAVTQQVTDRKGRTPFGLLFRGPLQPLLPQAIYRLKHEGMGSLDIFLVPVGQNPETGTEYEAIFN